MRRGGEGAIEVFPSNVTKYLLIEGEVQPRGEEYYEKLWTSCYYDLFKAISMAVPTGEVYGYDLGSRRCTEHNVVVVFNDTIVSPMYSGSPLAFIQREEDCSEVCRNQRQL
jgi:hypothetical protein